MHDLTAIENKEHFIFFLIIPEKHKIDQTASTETVILEFCPHSVFNHRHDVVTYVHIGRFFSPVFISRQFTVTLPSCQSVQKQHRRRLKVPIGQF